MKSGALIVYVALSFAIVAAAQEAARPSGRSSIDFFAEEITLTVSDSTANVSGIYYFRNNTSVDRPFSVLFPFHVDSTSAFPFSIRAFALIGRDTTEIPFSPIRERGAIVLRIPLVPSGVTAWHLDYSQKISSYQATYIITSTSAWGKPLEEATYSFLVPAEFDSVTVWPEADSINKQGDFIEYKCHKANFMPQQDMTIRWK